MRCDLLRRVRGFTIAETLVALAVFSFSVLGIVLALDATIDAARTMQRESLIRGELQSRLAILSNRPAREFSAKADANADGVTYQETVIPEQIRQEDATVLTGFWKVSVTARWMDRGEPQEWELSHLEYRP
jgi:type II secretory pathway component PulJ